MPKVRATRRSCTPARPHETQRSLDEVDRDDVEGAGRASLADRFRLAAVKRKAPDDDFGFARPAVLLALDDAAREDDVFEIEDGEIVIFQLFGSESRGTKTILR